MRCIFTILFIKLSVVVLFSQTFDPDRFTSYSTTDGLTDNNIRFIEQDKRGFVWIGTNNGLSRFDGYEFIDFEQITNFDFPDNKINVLYSDSNKIWIGTNDGLYIYEPNENQRITKFNKLESGIITSIQKYSDSSLLISTLSEIKVYNKISKKIEINISNINVNKAVRIRGSIYAGTWGSGLIKINIKSLEKDTIIETKELISNSFLDFIISNDTIYSGSYGQGIFITDTNGNNLTDRVYNENIRSIKQLNLIKNKLWISLETGNLRIYDLQKESINTISSIYTIDDMIEFESSRFVFKDRNSSIWIGTSEELIKYVPPLKKSLHLYSKNSIIEDDYIMSSDYRDNKFYLGSDKGYFTILENNKVLSNLNTGEVGLRGIYIDNKHIWLASYNGLIKIKNNRIIKKIRFNNINNQVANTINCIYPEDKNTLLLGTDLGVIVFNKTNEEYKLITLDKGSIYDYSYRFKVYEILDYKNYYLILNLSSISLLSKETKKFIDIHKHPEKNAILTDIEYLNDTVFISNGKGILYLEKDTLKTYKLIEQQINSLFSINNSLGYTTNSEIFIIKDKISIPGLDALSNFKFTKATRVFNDSLLLVAGENGINIIQKDAIKGNSKDIKPQISSFSNKSNGFTTYYAPKSHKEFNYNDDNIIINFSFPDSRFPSKVEYYYKLNNKNWIKLNNTRTAVFSSLKPNKYNLQYKVLDYDQKEYIGESIQFTIPPSLYQQWYFWILISVFIISYILVRLKLINNRIKKQKTKLENVVKQRTEELIQEKEQLEGSLKTRNQLFRILGHDLKNPFSTISGLSEVLLEDYKLEEKPFEISQHIKISADNGINLLENILSWNKIKSGDSKVIPEKFNIDEEVLKTLKSFKVAAKTKNINLDLKRSNLKVHADKYSFYTIIRNIISNAIKFSEKNSKIEIYSQQSGENVEIMIRDYGKGMEKSKIEDILNRNEIQSEQGTKGEKGTGLGLNIVLNIIKINNAKLSIESEINRGTTFTINFPIE